MEANSSEGWRQSMTLWLSVLVHAPQLQAALRGLISRSLTALDSSCIMHRTFLIPHASCMQVTPLWCAAMQSNHEVVAELASRGADLEATDQAGRTPVWVGFQSLEAMRVRCHLGPSDRSRLGSGCRGRARKGVADGASRHAQALVEHGAKLDTTFAEGSGQLINTVASNDLPELLQLMLDNGCDAKARASGGMTPLHDAAVQGQVRCIRVLADAAGVDLEATDSDNNTAMHHAAVRPDSVVYTFTCLLHGTSPHRGLHVRRESVAVVHRASAIRCRPVTVRFAFFGYGASRLVLRLGPDLANAAQLKGNVDAVMALVELGANINAKNSLGIYPIEAACMDGDDGNVAVVQFLCTLPTVSLTGFVYASVDKLENATGYDAGNFQMMGKALRDAGAPSDPTTP